MRHPQSSVLISLTLLFALTPVAPTACDSGAEDSSAAESIETETAAEGGQGSEGAPVSDPEGAESVGTVEGGTPDATPTSTLPEVWGVTPLEDLDPSPAIYEVELRAADQPMTLLDLDLDMYAYNGSLPGPLLHVDKGQKVVVHFTNDLPEPTTVHWHGLRIANLMDGTPRVQDPVQPGETFTYSFVVPDAGSYWYHPHVNTNEQLEKGLYGTIIVRDELDPTYDLERFVVLDDILLDADGLPPFLRYHMEAMHGRTGNVLLTNGSTEILEGQASDGQVERWRLVNTANARTMSLSVSGATWRVIGTDGGLLPEPYTTDRVVLPVGARYDVEVTYDGEGPVELIQHVLTLNEIDEVVEAEIVAMSIGVEAAVAPPTIVEWPEIPALPAETPTETHIMMLDAVNTPGVGVQWLVNGKAHDPQPIFGAVVGSTVAIKLFNLAGPEHPFHLHGQFFRIVARNGELVDEPGLRDTVLLPGMENLEIHASMTNPGSWMAHCHILEHAVLGMMSEFAVVYP